jgi:phage-related minor tail protein
MQFADGDVFNQATLFPMRNATGMLGEAGPEAIVPLRRGRDGSLGIAAHGTMPQQKGGPTINNTYNLNVPAPRTRDLSTASQYGAAIRRQLLGRG